MRGGIVMKARRYLLIVTVILNGLNVQADNTLFGSNASRTSSSVGAVVPSATMPTATMRSTSTLMYKSSAAPQVYVNPSQTVRFSMPNILPTKRTRITRSYTVHSYGGGGSAGGGGGVIRRSSQGYSQAVSFNGAADIRTLPTLPQRTRTVEKSQGDERRTIELAAMTSTASNMVKSGSELSKANAESYYTLYDAELEEATETALRRATRPGNWDNPYDDPEAPIGDVPVLLMLMLVAGYAWRVTLRRKAEVAE